MWLCLPCLKRACIFSAVGIFLTTWLCLVYLTLVADTSTEVVRLPSYDCRTKEEYQSHVPGLSYPATPIADIVQETNYTALQKLFESWPPDDTDPARWPSSPCHPKIDANGCSLRRFDYQSPTEMAVAMKYRSAELPFVLYNIPELDAAAKGAFAKDELLTNFGSTPRVVEKSADNQFLYYTTHTSIDTKLRYADWTPPQTELPLTFGKFLRLAQEAESYHPRVQPGEGANAAADETGGAAASAAGLRYPPLHYLTINAGEGGRTPWLTKALPFFADPDVDSFLIVDRSGYKGINCRYGMKGVAAAAHYDGQRNFVTMIRGRKRYVLLPPSECGKLSLLPKGHPSARHSDFDWAHLGRPDSKGHGGADAVLDADARTLRAKQQLLLTARATEYVLSMGEALYIPSHYFHYIVSQDASIQCNARSGQSVDTLARSSIKKCMGDAERMAVESTGAGAGLKGNQPQQRNYRRKGQPQWTLET